MHVGDLKHYLCSAGRLSSEVIVARDTHKGSWRICRWEGMVIVFLRSYPFSVLDGLTGVQKSYTSTDI
jgi:hypothetical protein